MGQEFERIDRLPPYVFSEVNEMKARARAKGLDIIDFGMGNPDSASPSHVVEKLIEAVQDPRTHRYSTSRGIKGLRRALVRYYKRRFDVDLDAEEEVIVTLGSKEGLANLASAISAPGDNVLVPNPSYPIHAYGFIIAGANVQHVPSGPGYDLIKEIHHAVERSASPPRALVLNFPNNPTAEVVDLAFYREVVELARRHEIFILSDIAYAEIYFDSEPPPSVLQVPGACDISVEFSSLSKTYSMPGWRVGFGAGNKRLISALARIKSYLDYGAFTPVQVAASAALDGPQTYVNRIRQRYRERRDVLIESFRVAGWEIPSPRATMFVWAPIPTQFQNLGSLEFSKLLLQEAQVAVSPGIGFGKYGDGYVRLALVENRQRIRQAARSIRSFLTKHGLPENSSVATTNTS